MTFTPILEIFALIGFIGWTYIAWVLLGRAAQHLGTGRMQVLGGIFLLGWLL